MLKTETAAMAPNVTLVGPFRKLVPVTVTVVPPVVGPEDGLRLVTVGTPFTARANCGMRTSSRTAPRTNVAPRRRARGLRLAAIAYRCIPISLPSRWRDGICSAREKPDLGHSYLLKVHGALYRDNQGSVYLTPL